jgi:hypothetical protein
LILKVGWYFRKVDQGERSWVSPLQRDSIKVDVFQGGVSGCDLNIEAIFDFSTWNRSQEKLKESGVAISVASHPIRSRRHRRQKERDQA